jgi:hypothetical protein
VTDATEDSSPKRRTRVSSSDERLGQTIVVGGRRVSAVLVKCPIVTEILDSRTQNILKVTHVRTCECSVSAGSER